MEIQITMRRLLSCLVLFSLYLIFHDSIVSFLSKTFLYTWFTSVHDDWLSDALFVSWALGIALIYSIRIVRRQASHNIWRFILFVISFAYFLERAFYTSWEYYPKIFPIKYLDIIFLLSVCEIISISISNLTRYKKVNRSNFTLVRPIGSSVNDKLDRNAFAKRIAFEINKSFFIESYSIAIVSEWSGGKSSFINLINESLVLRNRVVIKFQPWLNYSEGSLIQNFFNELKSSLSKYDSNLGGLFDSYYRSISSQKENLAAAVFSSVNPFLHSSSNRDQFDDINIALKRTGLQVVVICDDLDRLDQKEIVEFFKLIRNTANFWNTVYITAFDRGYVTNAVRRFTKYSPHKFIDKIFDFEYVLPETEYFPIITELNQFLQETLNFQYTLTAYSPELVYVRSFITNKRDLERFKQHMRLTFNEAANELVREELFVLELLRFRYPQVLSHFYKKHLTYLDWSRVKISSEVRFLALRKEKTNNNEEVPVLLNALMINEGHSSNRFHISNPEIQTIVAAFAFLFTDRPLNSIEPRPIETPFNSVRSQDYFDSYFRLIFNEGALRIGEFESQLLKSKGIFRRYVVNNLFQPFEGAKPVLILHIVRKNLGRYISIKNSYENVIFVLMTLESRGISVPKDLFDELFDWSNPAIQSYFTVKNNLRNYIIDFLNSEDFSIIGRSNFIHAYIYRLIKDKKFLFLISKEDLEYVNSSIFKRHLETQNDVSSMTMKLLYNNYHEIDENNHVVLNKDALGYLKKFITNVNSEGYLNLLIRPASYPNFENEFVFEPFLRHVFSGFDEFEEFLSSLSGYKFKDKLMEYFQRYKNNGYVNFGLTELELQGAPKEFVNMVLK